METKKMSKNELKSYRDKALNVGRLKKFIEDHELTDDAIIMIQRIEDRYYEKFGWTSYLKKGEHTTDDDSMEQYHPAWCCVDYADEKDNDILFIDLHW